VLERIFGLKRTEVRRGRKEAATEEMEIYVGYI
jgi:hypothetical protein